MRVARLEVFGFKSFMNRLMLPLEGGITGVVGPNGCGKSNIVDALRWVLGETRASNLRGELLEDVIFNGTDKFRPLGLAEVSITLRSRGDNFFSDLLTPLEVLRLEKPELLQPNIAFSGSFESRSGTSNEKLTDSQAASAHKNIGLTVIDGFKDRIKEDRAKDVDDSTNLENPVDLENPLVLEVGNPSDIAVDSENAAEEIPIPAILNRFSWLKATSEVQITRRLYRSGESEFFLNRVSCKLKDIKDLLRAVGLGPRSYTIVAQGEIGRIVSARPEDRRAIIEEAAGVLGIKDRIAAAKRRLDETRANLVRLEDLIGEASRQVNSLKRQAARAESRLELKTRLEFLDNVLLLARIARLDGVLVGLKSRLSEAQTQERALVEKLQLKRVQEQSNLNQLSEVETQGDALRLEVDQIKEEIHRRRRLLFEQEARLSELRSVAGLKKDESATNQERANNLRLRRSQQEQEKNEAQKEFDAVSIEVTSLEKGNDDELRLSNSNLQTAREVLRNADGKLRNARENLLRTQTRVSEVEKHIVASSPLTQIQRTLGERSPLTEELKRQSRPLSDALRVPGDLTTAVRAILGERAGFLVAGDPFEVARIAGLGELATRKNGFCLGVMRSSAADSAALMQNATGLKNATSLELAAAVSESTEHSTTGGKTAVLPHVVPLLTRISVEPWGQQAAEELLGNVLLAQTAESAMQFFSTAHDEQGMPVRRSETVVTLKGEMFTADSFFIFNHEGGVLELKVRLEQMQTELRGLESEMSTCTNARELAAASVSAAEIRNRQALDDSQARQAAVRALLNRQGNARGRLDSIDRMLRQTINDAERAEQAVRLCCMKIEEAEKSAGLILAKLEELKTADTSAAEARLLTLQEQYKALDLQRAGLRALVSTAANENNEIQRSIETLRREISRAELEQQKIGMDRQHVIDSFVNIYGQEAFNLKAGNRKASNLETGASSNENTESVTAEAFLEFERESATIRNRIIREGDVDPTTIEQYKIENERLIELTNQQTDLTKAVNTLAATVVSLEKASVERFVTTFNAVARHFELLIPRLFGGGRGELVLSTPDAPLQSGVEILVRPPGKKPKIIELLSGGEKALCATAMIFAMFLVRPSPLCVLDEVDAPLDEANLVRLLTLIKEMSLKTQFLMITHNKESMAMADNLVGVTMQEPGSTQILTVSLQEAFSHVG